MTTLTHSPADGRLHEANKKPEQAMHPLLASFLRHLRAERKSPKTIEHYIGSTSEFLAFCEANGLPPVERVTREHIELWLVDLHERCRPYTVRNRFVGLRLFLRWLVAEGEIRTDPTARMHIPKVEESPKDVVTQEDIRRTLRGLEKQQEWRDAAIVGVLYDTGMRCSELAGLRLSDVDLDSGIVRLAHTKNHRVRHVRLSASALRLVDRYLRRRPKSRRPDANSALFLGRRGALTRSGVYQVVREAFAAAGVSAVISPHDLRHTSASHIAAHLTESELMALFGWGDADMARHYTRQVRERLALDAHVRASPMERLSDK